MLLQRGSVGDDLWQRFLRAEKEMEEEVKDVVAEVSLLFSFYTIQDFRSTLSSCFASSG